MAPHVNSFSDTFTNMLSMSSGYSHQSSTIPYAEALSSSDRYSIRLEGRASYRSKPAGWTRYQEFMNKKQKLIQKYMYDTNNHEYLSSVVQQPTVCGLISGRLPCYVENDEMVNSDRSTELTQESSIRVASAFVNNLGHASGMSGRSVHTVVAVHSGQCRVYYDPAECQWHCWWSCCGMAHVCCVE